MAKVMVKLNISKGLLADIEIIWGSRVFHQMLDYLHIPFRNYYCSEVGHVKAKYPFLLKEERPIRSDDEVSTSSDYSKQGLNKRWSPTTEGKTILGKSNSNYSTHYEDV